MKLASFRENSARLGDASALCPPRPRTLSHVQRRRHIDAKMKHRVTYLPRRDDDIDPQSIVVGDHAVNATFRAPPAVEKRVTAGLSELPEEAGTQVQ